jgi:hypothetical protein
MHPHKLKSNLSYRGDVNNLNSKDKTAKELYWKEFQKEMGGRLISMSKRNVIYTATIEAPIRKSKLGVSENVNLAVIDDHKSLVYNLVGQTKQQEVHDGSSYITYLYSKMLDNSFPAKGYSGTKKQFGTLITEHGVTIKKDAENVITNDKIINSEKADIRFYDKQKQALGLQTGAILMNFDETFNNEFFYNHLGDTFKIDRLIIANNNYSIFTSKLVNGV